jgi:hypothetical protein
MKKSIILALVIVFALSVVAFAGPLDKMKDAAKAAKGGDKKELKLSDLDASLASYEATPFKMTKAYVVYGDAKWDGIALKSAKAALAVDFAEAVTKVADAKDEDLKAAQKALGSAKDAATIVTDATAFMGTIKTDPTKAVMLKDIGTVVDNAKTVADKAPKLLSTIEEKLKAKAAPPPAK